MPSEAGVDFCRIYVVWHPDFGQGRGIAAAVGRPFDDADELREFGGIRIPVFVRHEAFDPLRAPTPLAIDLSEARHNFVLILGSAEIVDATSGPLDGWLRDLAA